MATSSVILVLGQILESSGSLFIDIFVTQSQKLLPAYSSTASILIKMSVTRPDLFPSYPQAGFQKRVDPNEKSATCLQPPARDIQTPKDIQKFRKSYKQQPGQTIKHYGVVNDPIPQQNFTYGVPTEKSEGVRNIMKSSTEEGVNKYVNQLHESKYKSTQRQPLGKTIDRKYQMPESARESEFKFGQPTEKNEYGAKETIYSAINMPEGGKVREMYLKSHADYDAGEQKNRHYEWSKANVDPSDFRFGKVEKNIVPKQINQILSPESNSEKFPETKFVKTNQNDFANRKDDKLGKPANLGQKQFPSDHVFGVRIEPNEWDAGKCLKGEANMNEVRVDDDLGHSNRHGFRNVTKEGDENRLFGVPTIRYDIKKPERQSVADPNNYADETTAIELLFPKQFSSFGVDDDDFNRPRPKQQIREIFTNIGFDFKHNIFDTIFERSKAIEGTILDKVSCSSFKKTLYEMSEN